MTNTILFRTVRYCWLLMLLVSSSSLADNLSPLLNNRFRLDHGIQEITLVIYRSRGSAPVVLIQPDGKKFYASRHPEESVNWYDAEAFDLITIKQPMAGPWQVVGSIDPRNRMVTMSDVSMRMDPLPKEMYVGEQLKLTAQVVNRGQRISLKPFISQLKMEIWARSIALAGGEELSYNGLKLAEFVDNGTGLDETPEDGILSGSLDLNISADQYEVSFRLYNQTFERSASHSLRLLPSPVSAELVVVDEKPHSVFFQFDGSAIDLSDIAVTGVIHASDGGERAFSFSSQGESEAKFSLADINESGDYRLEANVFGRSVTTGREMNLKTNLVRFSVVNILPTPLAQVADIAGEEIDINNLQGSALDRLLAKVEYQFNQQLQTLDAQLNKPKPTMNWWLIAGVNLGLILLAVITLFTYKWIMLRRTQSAALAEEKKREAKRDEAEEDLIDLSLPED